MQNASDPGTSGFQVALIVLCSRRDRRYDTEQAQNASAFRRGEDYALDHGGGVLCPARERLGDSHLSSAVLLG